MNIDVIRTVAVTIGTNILTIKIYEYDGGKEDDISRLKQENEKLEKQLEKMIRLHRTSQGEK